MVIKMSYLLSHIVDIKKKWNRNNLSKSVMNSKQHKNQNTLSYRGQFMVKRPLPFNEFFN